MPNTAPAIDALFAEGTGALPSANAVGRAGVFYRIPASGIVPEQLWVTTNLTPTTYQWTEVSLSTDNDLGNYWVAPPVAGRPNAPYTTIQAAINAAVADGHNAANPAIIYITAGNYTENPIVHDGISLMGVNAAGNASIVNGANGTFANLVPLQATIIGSVSLDLGCTSANLINLGVFSFGPVVGAFPCVLVPAIPVAFVGIYGCTLTRSGAGADVLSWAATATSQLDIASSQLLNNTAQAGVGGMNLTTALRLNMYETSVQCGVGTDVAIQFGAASTVRATSCRAFGQLAFVAGATVGTFEDFDLTVSGATAYLNVTAGAPTFTWVRGSMTGGGVTPNIAGTLTLKFQGAVATDANGIQISATVTSTPNRVFATARTSRANGAADLTAANFLLADHHTLNTNAAPRGVALPVGALVPPGVPFGISADQTGGAAANAITVTPNGAETINGLNAAVVCAASVKGCCSLMRDPNLATNWILLSIT